MEALWKLNVIQTAKNRIQTLPVPGFLPKDLLAAPLVGPQLNSAPSFGSFSPFASFLHAGFYPGLPFTYYVQ